MDLQELIKDAGSFQLNRDYCMRLKEGKAWFREEFKLDD